MNICCDMFREAQEKGYSLGSHYHCAQCDALTGMYGHHSAMCKVTKERTVFHSCCPGACELDDVAPIRDEIAFWRGLEMERDTSYDSIVSDVEKKLKIALDRHPEA